MAGPSKIPLKDESNPDPFGSDDAIDDSEDMDEEELNLKKTMSEQRRRPSKNGDTKVQEVLPFPFYPNIRPLTISDIDSCVALEDAAFPNPDYRCTREKFEYRLSTCPELTLGLFCTVVPEKAKSFHIETLKTARPVETGRDDGAVSVLFAHIVSTRTREDIVTDNAMDYPRDFHSGKSNTSELGHQESGRNIALHSLAVHPKVQGCGLGKLLLKSYMQQMNNTGTVDRISLLCQSFLVTYYARHGFKDKGASKAQFGGGGWHDMVNLTLLLKAKISANPF